MKSISIAFFAATFVLGVFFLLLLATVATVWREGLADESAWHSFSAGISLAVVLLFPLRHPPKSSDFSWPRKMQTLFHELKHAAVVVLSGNVLTGFTLLGSRAAAEDMGRPSLRGQVTHKVYKSKRRFKPFINLAPYYFPLFSFPALFILLLSQPEFSHYLLCGGIGFLLGLDTTFALFEYRKPQMDFWRILGGRFIGSQFILAFHAMWISFCALWVVSGNDAFEEFVRVARYVVGL